ncbi:MAG: ABC transporter ATP-binding protein [Tessaracoccus sp.]|uniref:ABC transporter ATP-binding protein n=1 Tax=Tessaracoccus sp. TaxID=1971211 RepID=UPI001EBB582A|nr:ABC transporter ATP-binding protein [Tessaracoccus sp.]MBK7821926.1 ABC transporter ATP-binding protein [Tessaracoccus sp.]
MSTPLIDVRGLHMAYGDTQVLTGIEFSVHRGEVVGLLGPNGAGKTTTMDILEGFRRPSSGEVSVLGEAPTSGDEAWRARVGIVQQSWRDHAKWRVEEFLNYLGSYYRPYATTDTVRPWPTDELLKIVGLADSSDKQLRRLSGGQRRRLDVAVGIVGRPELLFLDEPTAGFDPEARRDFQDLIGRLADEGATILVTTHDLDEAEKISDRILILADGRIVADGSPDRLRSRLNSTTEITWTDDVGRHVHVGVDPTAFLRSQLADPTARMDDLEVRRSTLEDVYLSLVRRVEQGDETETPERSAARLAAGSPQEEER